VVGSGSAEEGSETWAVAEEVGRRLAEAGVVVVCGGRGGVMGAAARGAASAGGDAIGIVPSDRPADANEHCTHAVAAGTGVARNIAVVASGEAVIAIGGEWGTLSEIALARRFGRTVVTLNSWSPQGAGPMADSPGIEPAESAEEAVAVALGSI
jgi:uncharacterized protein (TIGR00725 family)